jgi:hypothetical protein
MNYTKKRLLDEQKKLSKMAPADRVVAEEAIMAEVEPETVEEKVAELEQDIAEIKAEVKKGKK